MKSIHHFDYPVSERDWVMREVLISQLKGAVLGKKHYFLSLVGTEKP